MQARDDKIKKIKSSLGEIISQLSGMTMAAIVNKTNKISDILNALSPKTTSSKEPLVDPNHINIYRPGGGEAKQTEIAAYLPLASASLNAFSGSSSTIGENNSRGNVLAASARLHPVPSRVTTAASSTTPKPRGFLPPSFTGSSYL